MSEQPSSKQVRFVQDAAVSKREKPVFVPRPVEYDQGEMNPVKDGAFYTYAE